MDDPGSFDPSDPELLARFVAVAMRQLARSAGTEPYAEMPTRAHAVKDLQDEMVGAALVALPERKDKSKTEWQEVLDAAVNAGRRWLYQADRELSVSDLSDDADSDEDDTAGVSLIDAHWSKSPAGARRWRGADEDALSDSDLERPYAPEKQPELPSQWVWWMLSRRADDGTLGEPNLTIVKNWLMDTGQLAALTGLTTASIRQRKHRLVESARRIELDPNAEPDMQVDQRLEADDQEMPRLPRAFDPTD
jgi:hypothetical protein